MKNYVSHSSTFITALISLLFVLCGCTHSEEVKIPSSKFTPYVTAYSGGLQSITDPIVIELAHEYAGVEPNTLIDEALFDVTPSVKGTAVWKDNQTIIFTPETLLQSNTNYTVRFALGQLYKLDSELRTFEFSFRTKIADGQLTLKDYHQYLSDADEVSVVFELELSDVLQMEKLNEALLVKDNRGKKYDVNIQAISETSYDIEVENISRAEVETITAQIDGPMLGLEQKLTASCALIPGTDLQIITVKRLAKEEQSIDLTFSEAIDPEINVESYIYLESKSIHQPYTYVLKNNHITLYLDNDKVKAYDHIELKVHASFRGAHGARLEKDYHSIIEPELPKPMLSFLSRGVILPDSKKQYISFTAQALEFVDLSIVKVFSSNVLSFLQTQEITSTSQLKRSGRLIMQKRIDLKQLTSQSLKKNNRFDLDLSTLFKQEPGAIYHIALSFKPEYTFLSTFAADKIQSNTIEVEHQVDASEWDTPSTYDYSPLSLSYPYDWRQYEWKERNNPEHISFYMAEENVSDRTNVYATNIGITVKKNDAGKLWFAVSNLLSTEPMGGVTLKAYSYQLQLIGTAHTDKRGFAELETSAVPFIVVAEYDKDKTYLKVNQGNELSVSCFDVGGIEPTNGLKGFIYGERGVWRPGDDIHLSFILQDREGRIPANHPVSLELFTPQGQFYTKVIARTHENGLYYFKVETQAEAPTGVWNAYVKIGGSTFHKSLRLETIKPNRLKISLDFKDKTLQAGHTIPASLQANWLMGATGSNLNADVELSVKLFRSAFPKYDHYTFCDAMGYYSYSNKQLFKGKLDGQGKADLQLTMPSATSAPGPLKASFISRVYEPGGDFSIHLQEQFLSPYSSYVGVYLTEENLQSYDWLTADKYLETDQAYPLEFIVLNSEQQPLANHNIHYEVYKISSWWWYDKVDFRANYIRNNSVSPLYAGDLITDAKGIAKYNFRVDYPEYGQYLVYVEDKVSGHSVTQTYYVDWPSWRGRSSREASRNETTLSLTLDQEEYKVGDKVSVTIPAASEGRALLSIESGSKVLDYRWIEMQKDKDVKYSFRLTDEMAPNVYVHVSLLQPHAQTVNDSPIRLYGVVPVRVSHSEARLKPIIEFPQLIEPEKSYTLKIKEAKGKPMTYTIAVVDEGLLDLNAFKTPDPYNYFYAKEALGIQTWDMFDQVIGAKNYSYAQSYRVGGDEILKPGDAKAKRFKPIVQFYGPYTLNQNASRQHEIKLPMYVGSVRAMIVASNGTAFGSSEQTIQVKNPLMVISSVPRVLSIGDELDIPVSVFAMESGIKEVSLELETSPNLIVKEDALQKLHFKEQGDKMAYFRVKVTDTTGIAKLKIRAKSGLHTATEEVEIDIRNPNPKVSWTEEHLLQGGETKKIDLDFEADSFGGKTTFEASSIPSINLSSRLDYLKNYEHKSTEAIVSKAMPLLYLNQLVLVQSDLKQEYQADIEIAIQELYGRQLTNGAFNNWYNVRWVSDWATAYATLFLIKAQEKGYSVNQEVLNRALNYLAKVSRLWSPVESSYMFSTYMAVYNLYVLAAANRPEVGTMNRMADVENLGEQSCWILANSYLLLGKKEIAHKLIFATREDHPELNYFGSSIRDKAFILLAYSGLGEQKNAFKTARELAQLINNETEYQTQSTAYGLMALAEYTKEIEQTGLEFSTKIDQKESEEVKSIQTFYQKEWTNLASKSSLTIHNKAQSSLYTQLIRSIQLKRDTMESVQDRGLKLSVDYYDLAGNPRVMNQIKQGDDIIIHIGVSNETIGKDFTDIAVTQIIPSGFEVYENTVFSNGLDRYINQLNGSRVNSQNKSLTYQDIRDDRVFSYFDLDAKESISFSIRVHATYVGSFVLPAVKVEVLSKPEVMARTKAQQISIVR